MSEPRTKAGRMLLKTYHGRLPPGVLDAYILAIEVQTAAPSDERAERLAAALRDCVDDRAILAEEDES